MPKKHEPASRSKSRSFMRRDILVAIIIMNNGISAITCLIKAIVTGGISLSTTLVLINDRPQNRTGNISEKTEK